MPTSDGHEESDIGGVPLAALEWRGVRRFLGMPPDAPSPSHFPTFYVRDEVLGVGATLLVVSGWSNAEIPSGPKDCGDGTIEPCGVIRGSCTPKDQFTEGVGSASVTFGPG